MRTKNSSSPEKLRPVERTLRDRYLRALLPLAIAAIASGFPAALLRAAEWTVEIGTDRDTIQKGIDAAGVGDTIVVKDGVYKGDGNKNLVLDSTKNITIRSENGREKTTIDLENDGRAFTFENGSTSTLDGIAIINGNADSGGAVLVDPPLLAASPVIKNCSFLNNHSNERGGAISVGRTAGVANSPVITNCVFENNYSGENGGAISVGGTAGVASSPVITNCVFANNHNLVKGVGYNPYGGGAIFFSWDGTSATAVIDNCSFSGNDTDYGGGICIYVGSFDAATGSFEISNCRFSNNNAYEGGAIRFYSRNNSGNVPTIAVRHSWFANNVARFGGAIANSSAIGEPNTINVAHCAFSRNQAFSDGGGIWTKGSKISNSIFLKNTARRQGGAVCCLQPPGATPGNTTTIIQCTLARNEGAHGGGAVYALHDVDVYNSILWGNSTDDGLNQIHLSNSVTLNIGSCNLEEDLRGIESDGDSRGTVVSSGGMIDANPKFALEEDLHVMPDSPCIDAGDNLRVPLDPYDLDGENRMVDGRQSGTVIVDMGAYEFDRALSPVAGISPRRLVFTAREGGALPDGQTVFIRNRGVKVLQWEVREEIRWLRVETSGAASVEGTYAVRLYVDQSESDGHGVHTGNVDVMGTDDTGSHLLGSVEVTLYVTKDLEVPVPYSTMQEAIDAAIEGDVVLVAEGTYKGDGNKNLDFLGKSITVKSKNGPEHTTIDCEGSGRAFYFRRAETPRSIIQGFTITKGHASGTEGGEIGGGGLIGKLSSATVLDCVFASNQADESGGGVCIRGPRAYFRGCTFLENDVGVLGGGMSLYNTDTEATVESCFFSRNDGAVYLEGNVKCTINNSNFTSNTHGGGSGGGIEIYLDSEGALTVSGCVFTGNHALGSGGAGSGGAIYALAEGSSKVDVYNSVFTANTAEVDGGAIAGTHVEVTHCTFYSNISGEKGGAISVAPASYDRQPTILRVTNSVFFGNIEKTPSWSASDILFQASSERPSRYELAYSVLYGSWSSEEAVVKERAIIDEDPLFKNVPEAIDNTILDGTDRTLVVIDRNLYRRGDVIEINNDGVARMVGQVSGGRVEFSPALESPSTANTLVYRWVPGTWDVEEDFRLEPASPCIDTGKEIPWLFSDVRGSLRPVDVLDMPRGSLELEEHSAFDIGAYEYSDRYGGVGGDLPTEAFKDLTTGGSLVVTNFEYEIEWKDRDPFAFDTRIRQAGEYDVNLALVNDEGERIDLGRYTVEASQHGYSIAYTFGAEHIGNWRIRVELASDPNQFVLSDEISIEYREVTEYALSQWIRAPAGADPEVKPDVVEEDACYWSDETKRLYAIAPVTTVITWYGDEERTRPLAVVAYITYPAQPRIHIADSMDVDLLPAGSRFDLAEIMYASNDAATSANKFSAGLEGWAVLLYRDQQEDDPDEKEKFDVVRTYVWDHAPGFSETDWDIGTEVEDPGCLDDPPDPDCHDAVCGSGYVFFEGARYDGYGETKAYDREKREGPIFAVNEDEPKVEDDLVLVWYKKSASSGVCWPSKPVRYKARWPWDAKKIVIASGLGSGPLPPDKYGPMEEMLIYAQADRAEPGYNASEEHAAFFRPPGSEYPVVFALRTDLNKPGNNGDPYEAGDRSRPFVLLKYRDPGTDAWKFEVFEVLVQSYVFQDGQVVEDDGGVEDDGSGRYYLDGSGNLVERSGELPAESYYIDAEGHLVNPADSEEVCYNYSGGSVVAQEPCLVHWIDGDGQLQAAVGPAPTGAYSLGVRGVLVESGDYRLHYSGVAGEEIIPPFPLNLPTFGPCADSYTSTEATVLEGKGGRFHAKHGGIDGEPTADGVVNYFYRLQPGFFYDLDDNGVPDEPVGSCVPWGGVINGITVPRSEAHPEGIPDDTVYAIRWPEVVPSLLVGETLTDAKMQEGETVGLPNVADQCAVDLLFDQSVAEGGGPSAKLIDPLREYGVTFDRADLPDELLVARGSNNRLVFKALPHYLQARLTYDELTEELKLKGYYERGAVESLLLLNTLTERDIMEISRVFMSQPELVDPENWSRATAPIPEPFKTALYNLENLGLAETSPLKDAEMKAVTTGDAQDAPSYVTLAFNDDPDCPGPVTLSVIKVDCPLYRGEIKVIESDDAFEEKVTLRHNGDFGGNSDARWFKWKYLPGDFSGVPTGPGAAGENWKDYSDYLDYLPGYSTVLQAPGTQPGDKDPVDGGLFHQGAVDVTVQGTGAELLRDRWFSVRYFYDGVCPENLSAWTRPQLYEGWVKRVMKKVNLFDQKVKDFHASDVNTLASMISLAGRRYEGDVELSSDPENLKNLGIIETYQTLLNRAKALAIDEGPIEDEEEAQASCKAILFAANRLAGLYVLLANEAYADATDPTIGFSTADGQYGTEAPSIFCFQNQVDSLLEEELVLLRGRDDEGVRPSYNRFIWNFTLGDGEVAYKENYNITDQATDQTGDGVPDAPDGIIDERDAMVLYPQGHGDAWGHYLTAIKYYYDLLRHPHFTWEPESETILVGQTPVEVDYRDERSFAAAAAAKARTGAEIVSLTYREHYVEDPEGQWQGYKDKDTERAWGVDGWSRRAGQGALFDWVVGNALLEPEDTLHEGVAKVDRTTVVELREVASQYAAVQAEVDRSSVGLNPLGIAKDAVPFDIDPGAIANGQTHFEQIYDRAVQAMNNAIAVFNHANQSTMLLRRQQDTLANFKRNIENSEADFNNRLVEIFGYPYEDDCGPGRTYAREYGQTGPDLYHYMYVDPSELMGVEAPEVHEFPVTLETIEVDAKGALQVYEKEVLFHVATDSRFGLIKPPEWRGRRKAPGEIQLARSDLLQTRGRFEKALVEYENLLGHIEKQADLIEAQHQLNADEIWILNRSKETQQSLNTAIRNSRFLQLLYRKLGTSAVILSNALAEAWPTNTGVIAGFSFGTIVDMTSIIRSAIKLVGQATDLVMSGMADLESLAELDHQQAKEIESAQMNIDLTALRADFAVKQQLLQLENLIRTEATLRLEIYTLAESLQQSAGRYLAALARGERLLQDRLRFRRQTAAQIQDYRYKDMTFRIFRNDALQKYRAQFDMAASYVYLAAKAYDYETTLLDHDTMAGEAFFTDIVRQRTIGMIEAGQPITGTGLADPMRRMWQNFQVLKPQLGFNNPQQETNRFSLRRELFRIQMDAGSNPTWRQVLEAHRVDDLWDVAEFRRYCRPYADEGLPQPAIVIPFSTTVTAGLNFFEWPLGGRDSYYSAANFATKVRSVGVWFSNYNAVQLAETPRIYLIPVGQDVLRTPSHSTKDIRTWRVVDQKLPLPFPIVRRELENNPGWIPTVDTVFDEMFQIRRHSDFRAYHDSGFVNESEMTFDSRLVGRSVWNTGWLLVIPGQSLLHDPDEGLGRFIHGPEVIGGTGERDGNGVTDIKLFFHTYAYSGN